MAKERRKIITFEDYLAESMQSDTICEKFVTSRSNWLKEDKGKNEPHTVSSNNLFNILRESKTEKIIDKVPSDELPEAENLENSKVGDFLPSDIFTDMYDDKEDILGGLKDGDVLAYCCIDGATTWWKIRKDKDGDGLIRIQ